MSLSSWRKPDLGADGKIKSADADIVRSNASFILYFASRKRQNRKIRVISDSVHINLIPVPKPALRYAGRRSARRAAEYRPAKSHILLIFRIISQLLQQIDHGVIIPGMLIFFLHIEALPNIPHPPADSLCRAADIAEFVRQREYLNLTPCRTEMFNRPAFFSPSMFWICPRSPPPPDPQRGCRNVFSAPHSSLRHPLHRIMEQSRRNQFVVIRHHRCYNGRLQRMGDIRYIRTFSDRPPMRFFRKFSCFPYHRNSPFSARPRLRRYPTVIADNVYPSG